MHRASLFASALHLTHLNWTSKDFFCVAMAEIRSDPLPELSSDINALLHDAQAAILSPQTARQAANDAALTHLVASVERTCADRWIGGTHGRLRQMLQPGYTGVYAVEQLHQDLTDPDSPLSYRGHHGTAYESRSSPNRISLWANDPVRANIMESSADICHTLSGCLIRYIGEALLAEQRGRNRHVLDACCYRVDRYLVVPDGWAIVRCDAFGPPPPPLCDLQKTRIPAPGDTRFVGFYPRAWPMSMVNDTILPGLTHDERETCTDELLFTLIQAMVFLVSHCKLVPRVFTLDNIMLKATLGRRYRVLICGHGYTMPAGSLPPVPDSRVRNYLAPEELKAMVADKQTAYPAPRPVSASICSYMLGCTWHTFLTGEYRVPNVRLTEEEVLARLDGYFAQPPPQSETKAARICRLLSVEDPNLRMPLRQALFELKPVNGIPQRLRTCRWYIISVITYTTDQWQTLRGDPRQEYLYQLLLTSQYTLNLAHHCVMWHYTVEMGVGLSNVPVLPPSDLMWDEVKTLLSNTGLSYISQNMAIGELLSSSIYDPHLRQILQQYDPASDEVLMDTGGGAAGDDMDATLH